MSMDGLHFQRVKFDRLYLLMAIPLVISIGCGPTDAASALRRAELVSRAQSISEDISKREGEAIRRGDTPAAAQLVRNRVIALLSEMPTVERDQTMTELDRNMVLYELTSQQNRFLKAAEKHQASLAQSRAPATALPSGETASARPAQTASPTFGACKTARGSTGKDLNNALAFCRQVVLKEMDIQGVIANDSIVHIKVVRDFANALMADRLSAEQLIIQWMSSWKTISGSSAVAVFVEWNDVEVAKGQTTLLSGDEVTIKQQ